MLDNIFELNMDIEKNVESFFDYFGGCHDSKILNLNVDYLNQMVLIELDDIYANYLGLPEYQGPMPLKLIMQEVKYINIDLTHKINNDMNVTVYDIEIKRIENGNFWEMIIKIAPDGNVKLTYSSLRLKK